MGKLSNLGFILQFLDLIIRTDGETGISNLSDAINIFVDRLDEKTNKRKRIKVKVTDEMFRDLEAELITEKPKVNIKKVENIDDRISYIIYLIKRWGSDPRTRKLATRILTIKCGDDWCIKEKDWMGEVKLLFDVVRKRVRYVRDIYDKDTFTSPLRTFLEYKAGDCDDYTVLLGSLLFSIGYPIKLKVVQTRPNKTWNHIYLLVGIPPYRPIQWIPLDASQPKEAGWEVPKNLVIKEKIYDIKPV